MKLTYDPRYNVAYIRLQEKDREVITLHISDAVNVDLAPDGTVFGIELLNANEQLHGSAANKVVVENEATGTSAEIALP